MFPHISLKKETKIEIFFWLVVLFVFSPRILLEVYEHKLKNSLIPFENNEWTVKDKDGNVIYENLTLPFDLRWKEQRTDRRAWVFEKTVNNERIKNLKDVGIVLGRMGDSDYVIINTCLIGSSGYDIVTKKTINYAWSQLRRYPIPISCLTFPTSKLQVQIYKSSGPGFGMYQGPYGFGQFSDIQTTTKILDFLKYEITTIFALGLIFFVGVQYLFIFLISDRREIYGIFSILSFFVGLYLFGTSAFSYFSNIRFLVTFIFFSAYGSTVVFLIFFMRKFKIFGSKLFFIYMGLSTPLFVAACFMTKAENVYRVYEYWHPFFLSAFVIAYFQLRSIEGRVISHNYFKKYILSLSIFIFCCFHDVVLSVFASSNSYLIGYAFTFFVLVVGLTLSQEYSDAFSNIEDQVVQRTDDLNGALVKIKQVQFLKDDQAKRFAHDIRSPLAALQVLKEIVSQQLQDDAKDLLKHTIVRINDLANTALPRLIDAETPTSQETDVFLWPVLDKLVSEKRLEYTYLSELKIELKNLTPIFELHARCDEIELTRMVSNLINNSIEARKLDQSLLIYIYIERNNFQIEISIEDFGKGIPEQYLNDVFKAGFSYGKKGGMGVGLSHAKNMLETWGGKINIDSKVNIGTNIKLQIPISNSPDWLLTKLNLNVENLVIVDDHAFVVDTWRQKLVGIVNPPNIYWVQNRLNWDQSEIHKLNWKNTLFLVDQDLGSGTNGLDLIKEFNLYCNTVLVTGNNDDLELRKKAVKLGIKILPKALIHIIPVVTPS